MPKKVSKAKKPSTRKKQSVSSKLQTKAKGSKFTPSQLRKVYNRGLAAYASSGSRKGMSSHQWAMARVYSYIMGGKTRQVDKEITKKYNVKFRD